MHTVKEMKDWGDPAEITSTSTFPLNAAMATLEYDIPEGGGSGEGEGRVIRWGARTLHTRREATTGCDISA